MEPTTDGLDTNNLYCKGLLKNKIKIKIKKSENGTYVVDEVDERMVSNKNRRQLSSFTFNNGIEMKENQFFYTPRF